MDFPIYDVDLQEDDLGLTAISFVDFPAIKTDFIYFKDKPNQQLYLSSNEKREVVSPILIPNQLIYREDIQNGEKVKYYVRWTAPIIEKAALYYLINQFNNNVSIMHQFFLDKNQKYEDTLVENVYLKRMWIVDDPKKDPINNVYGFNGLPEGTLCVHYKIHNQKLWQRIKSGELKGLSIEAFTSFKLN